MSVKLVCVGNIGAGKTSLCSALAPALSWPCASIDDARRATSDGTAAGEARAWASFLTAAAREAPTILECSGGGPFVHLLRHALIASTLPIRLVFVRTPVDACLERVRKRGLVVPYPDFGVPIETVIESVHVDLERQLARAWRSEPRLDIDGTAETAASCESVTRWLAQPIPSAT